MMMIVAGKEKRLCTVRMMCDSLFDLVIYKNKHLLSHEVLHDKR